MTPPVSRGFHRRRPADEHGKLPPGQYLTEGFPASPSSLTMCHVRIRLMLSP